MIIYQSRIYRVDLQANPDVIFVFGDNGWRKGMGGQAKEIRGEPNALGVVTKKATYDVFSDDDFEDAKKVIANDLRLLRNVIFNGITVVFPLDGIGTGLANLKECAPKIWAFLCVGLAELGIRNGPAS
jgi:hypothetical protein